MKLFDLIFESVVDMYEGTKINKNEFVQRLEENELNWTEDKVRQQAKKYNSKYEFSKGNQAAYRNARRLGIINDLGFAPKLKSWDEESVRKEAAKYNSKSEFKYGNQTAYNKAHQLGIINDLGYNTK